EPLPWPNSTLVRDVPADVERLKEELDGDLLVMGSSDLIQTLMRHDLIDEYLLVIHPLVLGTGGKLFAQGSPRTTFRLVDCTPTTTGALIATYRPVR
ncbi:MAG TPA: dihydrofolate reductase family protein, partial [Actinomycetota bacterium]|nr:dihydrofolate reductase family protein [Actinomycetota bacterium]